MLCPAFLVLSQCALLYTSIDLVSTFCTIPCGSAKWVSVIYNPSYLSFTQDSLCLKETANCPELFFPLENRYIKSSWEGSLEVLKYFLLKPTDFILWLFPFFENSGLLCHCHSSSSCFPSFCSTWSVLLVKRISSLSLYALPTMTGKLHFLTVHN